MDRLKGRKVSSVELRTSDQNGSHQNRGRAPRSRLLTDPAPPKTTWWLQGVLVVQRFPSRSRRAEPEGNAVARTGPDRTVDLVCALELEAAVNLLRLLVVLVHQVQFAVAQRHPLLVLPAYEARWRRRRRWALAALWFGLAEVRPSPRGGAEGGRGPPVVVRLFVFGGRRMEQVREFVEELSGAVGGRPRLWGELGVVDGGGLLDLRVQV